MARSLPASSPTSNVTVRLDFEGLVNLELVGDYYGGGGRGGPNYGVVFGPGALASIGEYSAPDPSTSLAFQGEMSYSAFMTVEAGFTGLSFQYRFHGDWGGSASTLQVYDGPNATGTVIGTHLLPETYDTWVGYSFQLSEIAKSLEFNLMATMPMHFDDMDIALVSLPQTPSQAPAPSACEGTTQWIYNAATNKPIRRLVNKAVTCLVHPYSIDVRPCASDIGGPTAALSMRLLRTFPDRSRRSAVVHRQVDAGAPYFLFGGDAAGNVFPSPAPLPNGNYQLMWSSGGGGGSGGAGKVVFTQSCPCLKGRKGCMMMMKRPLKK